MQEGKFFLSHLFARLLYDFHGKVAASKKAGANTQSGSKFIDTLIVQWMKRTGSNITFQVEEVSCLNACNVSSSFDLFTWMLVEIADGRKSDHAGRRAADSAKPGARRANAATEIETQSGSGDFLVRVLGGGNAQQGRDTDQVIFRWYSVFPCDILQLDSFSNAIDRLNGTWESIETITEYFNYISENLASFQQHHANLSALYDNVILKQQEAIRKLQSSNAKSRGKLLEISDHLHFNHNFTAVTIISVIIGLEQHIAQLENRLLLQEGR